MQKWTADTNKKFNKEQCTSGIISSDLNTLLPMRYLFKFFAFDNDYGSNCNLFETFFQSWNEKKDEHSLYDFWRSLISFILTLKETCWTLEEFRQNQQN